MQRAYVLLLSFLLSIFCASAFASAPDTGELNGSTIPAPRIVGFSPLRSNTMSAITQAPIQGNETVTDLATLEDMYSSVLIGRKTGRFMAKESDSVYIGNEAGWQMSSEGYYETGNYTNAGNGEHNTAVGTYAMGNASIAGCTLGSGAAGYTVAIGAYAMANEGCTTGSIDNTGVGDHAGFLDTTGSGNTYIGGDIFGGTTGSLNVFMGYNTGGFQGSSESNNTFIGAEVASTHAATGSGNILIGVDNTTDTAAGGTSNTLLIKGISGGTAAISGTGLNGSPLIGIGTGTPDADTLSVNGAAHASLIALTISGATFTPTFNTANDFNITLPTSGGPFTLANPSGTILPGQHGVIYITQPATGTPAAIGTWGSDYITPGGTSGIAISTTANARDSIVYSVQDATHIWLFGPSLNATH